MNEEGSEKKTLFVSYHPDDQTFFEGFKWYFDSNKELIKSYELTSMQKSASGDWVKKLEPLLQEAAAVVALWSPDYIQSIHCVYESVYASLNDKLIPVKVRQLDKVPEEFKLQTFVSYEGPPDYLEGQLQIKIDVWTFVLEQIGVKLDEINRKKQEIVIYPPESSSIEIYQNILSRKPPLPFEGLKEEIFTSGRITPFLGSQCSSHPDNFKYALEPLRQLIETLVSKFGNDNDKKCYLRSVVEAKIGTGQDWDWSSITTESSLPDSPLLDLQVILVNIGILLCRIIGSAMMQPSSAHVDFTRHKFMVSYEDNKAVFGKLFISLYEGCEKAGEVRDSFRKEESIVCFGGEGIYTKLINFTYNIISNFEGYITKVQREKFRNWKHKHQLSPRVNPTEEGTLSLSQLEWLGNLLWYSMTYDLPMLPQNDDLVFRLALCSDKADYRKARLNTACGVIPDIALLIRRIYLSALEKIVEAEKSAPASTGGFYEAIAKCLCQGIQTMQAGNQDNETCVYHENFVPIVVTLNFDPQIDRYLDYWGKTYHVLFPVIVKGKEQEKEQEKEQDRKGWLLSTKSSNPAERVLRLVDDDAYWEILKILEGPLIVKSRGDPLEELPPGKVKLEKVVGAKVTKVTVSLQHLIGSTDCEFTRSIMAKAQIPKWTKDLIKNGNRCIVYLGYPMDDPDGIFPFHGDVTLSLIERDKGGQRKILIDYPADDFLHADLGQTGVELWVQQLDAFAALIHAQLPMHI